MRHFMIKYYFLATRATTRCQAVTRKSAHERTLKMYGLDDTMSIVQPHFESARRCVATAKEAWKLAYQFVRKELRSDLMTEHHGRNY